MDASPLTGRIALVTGATRGAGRAIARELAAAGAHVYCTGRSTRTQGSDYDRTETIEGTAELIAEAGGTATAVAVDHRYRSQVESLIARIESAQGRLDILVNDIGGEAYVDFDVPLWDYDWEQGMKLFDTGFVTHLITSHAALGLLSRTREASSSRSPMARGSSTPGSTDRRSSSTSPRPPWTGWRSPRGTT